MKMTRTMAQRLFLFCVPLCVSALLFICSMLNVSADANSIDEQRNDSLAKRDAMRLLANHLEFSRICDTVFVLGNRFIEVNLQMQRATLRYRNGDSMVIPISSGNLKIKEAISTPTGIFSIQAKTPEALSRQFDNTKMLWWIGFNYNVGFHGLERDSYYKYLGVRPSSHGCVRTGREDVHKLYNIVDIGDPVIVFDTVPARILAFADTLRFDTTKAFRLTSRTKQLGKLMSERLHLLYTGRRIAEQQFSVFIPRAMQLRPGGFGTGIRDSVLAPQEYPSTIVAGFVPAPDDVFHRSSAFDRAIAHVRPSRTAYDSLLTARMFADSVATDSARKALVIKRAAKRHRLHQTSAQKVSKEKAVFTGGNQ